MKKNLLLSLILTFATNAFAQVNEKNNSSYHTTIYSKTNDVDFEQNMLGDEILWSTTFADSSSVSTEDVGGFGDWKWSTTAPGGQWSENSGIIESETPNDGFMLMEADFYNTSPQNGVVDGEVGENARNLAQAAVTALQTGIEIPGLNSDTQKAVQAALSGAAIGALGSNVSPQSVISRSTGQILNNNLELLFKGVNLRSFPYLSLIHI